MSVPIADLTPSFASRLPLRDEPRLALFDADGTLWDDDIADDFTLWMIGTRRIATGARWAAYRELYLADGVEACRHLLGFFRGMAHLELRAHVETYWRERMRLPWIQVAVDALRWLARQGFRIWVVTGSPTDVLAPLCGRLPVERILGVDFELDRRGLVTGEVAGPICAGDGKPTKIRAAHSGVVQFVAGNSSLDAPMLSLARDLAWAIHPGDALAALARERGWAVEPAPAVTYGSAGFPPTLAGELRARGLPIPEDL